MIRGAAAGSRDVGTAGEFTVATSHGDAVVALDRAAEPGFTLALTHGAAGGVDAADLIAARDAALALGGTVARVIQAYRVRGGRAPGSAARQDESWIEVMAALPALVAGGQAGAGPPRPGPASDPGRPEQRCTARLPHRGRGRGRRGNRPGLPAPSAGSSRTLAPQRTACGGRRCARGERQRDPFGIPDAADVARLVVLAGEGHALSQESGRGGPRRSRPGFARGCQAAGEGCDKSAGCDRPSGCDRPLGVAGWWQHQVCGPVRSYHMTVWQQFARVIEQHNPVAEQAPTLLGVRGQSTSRLAVR